MSTDVGVLHNSRIYVGGTDLTPQTSEMEYALDVQDLAYTPYGVDGWEYHHGGQRTLATSGTLWYNSGAGSVDELLFDGLGEDSPLTIIPARNKSISASTQPGERCWLGTGMSGAHMLSAKTDALATTKLSLKGSGMAAKGKTLNDPTVVRTATGNGTAIQLAAVPDGKSLILNLHVISTGTGSLTVAVQSDDGSGFGSPATVATFSAATASGWQTIQVDTPNPDTWYRATWTISGGAPSFLFLVSAGITRG